MVTEHKYSPARFWAKVDKRGQDECWLWTASKNNHGYGQFAVRNNGRPGVVTAHRIAYRESNGPIPAGMEIDHRCHNRDCVNPKHLRAATKKQNMENRRGARTGSKSGVRGVWWDEGMKMWKAGVSHAGQRTHLGYFRTIQEAASAAKAKRNELFTHNNADRIAA